MAENQDGQEKTEPASPKRQQEARKKGNVARSRELNHMAMLVASAVYLLTMGEQIIDGIRMVMHRAFAFEQGQLLDPSHLPDFFLANVVHMLKVLSPFFAVTVIVALVAPSLLGGWVFSAESLGFQLSRLDPLKGIARVFGWQGLVESLKTLLKFTLIGGVAIILIWTAVGEIMTVGEGGVASGLGNAGKIVSRIFLIVCTVTVIIAAIDVPFQLWQHDKKLRMTQQEVRDEHKDTEGRPEVKSRIRGLQQEMARKRMMEEIPNADVVITNPTHFALALKYDADNMVAPKLLAKGKDVVAERIRAIAVQHNVALFRAPPLARALYRSTKLNQEIPTGLYVAVAQILAYVYQLKAISSGAAEPEIPNDLPIPDEFKVDPS